MRVRNSPAYLAGTVVRAGAQALWGLFVPSALSVAAYGEYGLLAATIMMASQLSMLGTPQVLISNARRDLPVLGLLWHATVLVLLIAAVPGVILPGEIGVAWYPLVVACALAALGYKVMGARARAQLSFGAALGSELGVATTLLLVGLGMVALPRDCGHCRTGAITVAAEGLAFFVGTLVLITIPSLRLRAAELTTRGTTRWLRSVYSVGLLTVFDVVLLRRLEVFFLQRSPNGMEGVAVWTLAVQFSFMLQLLPVAVLETWQPQLAILWRTDRDQFRTTFDKIQHRYLLMTTAVFSAGIPATFLVISRAFHQYAAWAWVIGVIAGSRILFVATSLYSATLYALGLQLRLYLPVFAGSAVAVAANIVLTLRYGIRGAVIAYIMAQVTFSWLTWLAFRNAVDPELDSGLRSSQVSGDAGPTL